MAWIQKNTYKKGTRYFVRFRQNDKIVNSPPFVYLDKAREYRDDLESGRVGMALGRGDDHVTVKTAADRYLASCSKEMRASTVNMKKYALKELTEVMGDSRLSKVSKQDLLSFREALLGGKKSANGAEIVLRNVRAFFGYCVERGYILNNPCSKLPQIKTLPVARYLTDAEISKIIELSPIGLSDLVRFSVMTGLTVGELAALSSSNISNGVIHIYRKKTGKPRIIPIHGSISSIASRWDRVIDGWSVGRIGQAFRRVVHKAVIGRVRFHDLRHTFASNYLKAGGDLNSLAHIMGVTLPVLQIYTHFQRSYYNERIAAMPGVD